jgi:hypothetical protein
MMMPLASAKMYLGGMSTTKIIVYGRQKKPKGEEINGEF